jgi:prevent-host-death family protein
MPIRRVGIFEAKTHLSSLVDEVEKGGEVVITRHGKPVARLVRAEHQLSANETEQRRKAWRELREIGQRLNVNASLDEIKSWIDEGRR